MEMSRAGRTAGEREVARGPESATGEGGMGSRGEAGGVVLSTGGGTPSTSAGLWVTFSKHGAFLPPMRF